MRRLELRHQPAQHRNERLIGLGGDARSVHLRPAGARTQNEERVLAEKRVPRDLLSPFDALEEERVVGVLRDLEKRGDRRQQVRHDLANHRHERAAAREVCELVERCLLHERTPAFHSGRRFDRVAEQARQAAPARSTFRTDVRPGRSAFRSRRSSSSPASRACRISGVSDGEYTRSKTISPSSGTPSIGTRDRPARLPADVAFTSTSHVPGAGGYGHAFTPTEPATCRASSGSPRAISPPRRPRASAPPPPPAPRLRRRAPTARVPFSAIRPLSGVTNPATSVFEPSQRSSVHVSVLIAPTSAARASQLSTRLSMATLKGAVMLAPRMLQRAREPDEVVRVPRFERDVGGIHARSDRSRRCAWPATGNARRGCRQRRTDRRRAGCDGTGTRRAVATRASGPAPRRAPAYVHRLPSRAASTRVDAPGSPIAISTRPLFRALEVGMPGDFVERQRVGERVRRRRPA